MQNIPTIDISPLAESSESELKIIGNLLCDAAQAHGFFYVKGHGVADAVVDSAFDTARRFFTLPEETKSSVRISGPHRGYLKIGESTMEGYSGADQKESFIWGLDLDVDESVKAGCSLLAVNRWPDAMPQMRSSLNEYFNAAHECASKILDAAAVALGQRKEFFSENFRKPTSRGSLIHYPAGFRNSGEYGVSPHTDFGCLSLLAQRDSGLRVEQRDGRWIHVDPVPDTFVVNVGDLLSRWTNGRFRSVPHCVVNESEHARFSVVVFVDPDSHTMINPIVQEGEAARYDSVDCDTYITGRFDRSFAYRH